MNRILYASGGSGGHLAPAIALAQKSRKTSNAIAWISTTRKAVDRRMQEAYRDLEFVSLYSAPLQGNPILRLFALGQTIRGVWQASRFLEGKRIDHVFATGGFGCVPAILGAWILGLPVSMHESNSVAGKVTRWFRPGLTQLYGTRLMRKKYTQEGSVKITGFPIRQDFEVPKKTDAKTRLKLDPSRPVITIFGGSQGAMALTKAVEHCSENWEKNGYQLICVTGPNNYQPKGDRNHGIRMIPFVEEMGVLLAATDVLVARSGAGSIAEIAEAGCPSLLIPLPGSADQHQQYNADAFVSNGCAELLTQEDIGELEERVEGLIGNPEKLDDMRSKLAEWAKQNTIDSVLNDLCQISKGMIV